MSLFPLYDPSKDYSGFMQANSFAARQQFGCRTDRGTDV